MLKFILFFNHIFQIHFSISSVLVMYSIPVAVFVCSFAEEVLHERLGDRAEVDVHPPASAAALQRYVSGGNPLKKKKKGFPSLVLEHWVPWGRPVGTTPLVPEHEDHVGRGLPVGPVPLVLDHGAPSGSSPPGAGPWGSQWVQSPCVGRSVNQTTLIWSTFQQLRLVLKYGLF